MNKVHQGLFLTTSNEVTWPKKSLNSMLGLKSAILAILSEIGRLAGLAVPCSAALHGRKWLYQLLPINYELRLPSEVTPGLLPFRSRSKKSDILWLRCSCLNDLILGGCNINLCITD
jgi:hypothetical protein